ncbi:MAG: type II toxin-antitoxin system VapC family toxin [Azonexus sp.]|jgi:predicted nucleic acid-binding protein|uniref:type II toxin-antitoxin system VapC family toxin n=1 Tax=Azonexus sp. TaxID=1872668 RepID=UPI002820FB13|nr:type II toxin-antitoxin system VapC family toxin [Azonexus sp.]MDR0775955.1 type II toxin-antitoxin system VapC family toxin [Azonexus sp.]
MTVPLRVVDTSAWIEWLTGSALGQALGNQFPDKPRCIVPTIVQLELSKWLVRELGEEQADHVIAYTQKCLVVPLDTPIALLAADLHREHKLATADAIVYATAQHRQAELLTCDAHFAGLPDVVFFSKPM